MRKIDIRKELVKQSEESYKKFSSSLIPTASSDTVIGVRMPNIKKLAKTLSIQDFEKYYCEYHEEKLLKAFVISNIRDFEECIVCTEKFLPTIDNWAICDSFRPKSFKSNKERLYEFILKWLLSKFAFTVRFAIGMLMVHFLDEDFDKKHLTVVSKINSDDYYVNMMISWYFATALSKQFDDTVPFLEQNLLKKWIHNKTIQKACESARIDRQTKIYLKKLKR